MPVQKSAIVGVVIFCIFSFFPLFSIIAATTISFSNAPKTIDQLQEFEIDVSLLCSGCTSDSYLRGVFYPSGTSYFGYTQNNSGTWINAPGGSCTEYFKIASTDLKDGSWSGRLKLKPDIPSPYYNSPGDYLFKVSRYTNSCGTTWSTETTITITGPTNTPTLTPTNAPTYTPTNTPTNTPMNIPTSTLKSANTSTPKPTDKIIQSQIQSEISTLSGQNSEEGDVLGAKNKNTATSSVAMERAASRKVFIITFLFIGIGSALLSLAIVLRKQFF